MTASTYQRLARTVLNLIREAVEQSITASKPVKILLNGSTVQGDLTAPQRNVVISFAEPELTSETRLWVNPANRLILKSNPATKQWHQIFEVADMFSPYEMIGGSSAGNIEGTVFGQPLATTAELQAVDTTGLANLSVQYVVSERTVYIYLRYPPEAAPEQIVVPISGGGAWLRVSSKYCFLNSEGGVIDPND